MSKLTSTIRGTLFVACAAASLIGAAAVALAQTAYPEREIKILVGFTAGGTTDVIARMVGQELSIRWNKPVVIDNRPGAAGNIAIDMVAKAKPDGYTLAIGSVGPLAVNATLYKAMPYDNLKDLTPVTLIADVPTMLVVNPLMIPSTNLKEFIDHAKAKPNTVFYGSTGSGTMAHLAGEMLQQRAGIQMTHVPFKGATGVTDMLGGQSVCCMFGTIPSVIQYVKAGRLKAFAVSSAKRSASSPDVPSVAELGYPGFDGSSWFGLVAPIGTPRDIVDKLHKEIVSILAKPDIRDKLVALGADPIGNTPEEFAAHMKAETEKWGKLVKDLDIKAD
jgi:tripartite-type tricarboxylate transporter receptor subunit TctC